MFMMIFSEFQFECDRPTKGRTQGLTDRHILVSRFEHAFESDTLSKGSAATIIVENDEDSSEDKIGVILEIDVRILGITAIECLI